MKILSVQHYPAFGGPHNELLVLEPRLNQLGIETTVALTSHSGDALQRLQSRMAVHTIELDRFRQPSKLLANWNCIRHMRRDVRGLRRLIQDTRPDVVKVHGVHNPQGALAGVLEGVPVVLVLSSDLPHPLFRRLGMRAAVGYASSILSTGTRILHAYPAACAVRDRIFPYFPPVDVHKFFPASEAEQAQARNAMGLPLDSFVVGSVANVNPQKGIDVLVEVARRVLPLADNVQFVVVGNVAESQQAYFERIHEQMRHLGVDPLRLRFFGPSSTVDQCLKAFDVMLLTSRAEGIPTTALEAMSSGLPVVATNVGSVTDAIENGLTGLVEESLDVVGLANAVTSLWASPDFRRFLGANARRRALEQFDLSQCAEVHQRAYSFAMEAKHRL